jgi:hypothetical protein
MLVEAAQDIPDDSVTRYDCREVVKSARQLSGPPTTYELARVVVGT